MQSIQAFMFSGDRGISQGDGSYLGGVDPDDALKVAFKAAVDAEQWDRGRVLTEMLARSPTGAPLVELLERQIAALLFERLSMSRDSDQVRDLARHGQQVAVPSDAIKDPFVLELLDLREKPTAQERDLDQAIIGRLEEFLLEMGKGFCFVARQKRLTLEDDHFYVDLVFYNRLLRCFVLVDLKLGKLTNQDLGQMQMYVSFFDRFQRAEHESKTIEIVLCSEKNDAMVKITLPGENEQNPGGAVSDVSAYGRRAAGRARARARGGGE